MGPSARIQLALICGQALKILVFFQVLFLTFSSSHFTYAWVISSILVASEVTFYQLMT